MKVLTIGSDVNVLVPGTPAHKRMQLQAAQVEGYTVLVPQAGESKPAAALSLWRRSRGVACDVVSSQDPFFFGLLGLGVARRAGARLNVQVHTDLSAQSFFRHVLAQIVLRHADSIRVVSQKLKKQVEAMGVKAPIHVLPIYIDIEKFKNIQHQPHSQKTIVWVGRFEEEKDPALALSVLSQVRAAGIDAKLVMLGSGSMDSTIKSAAHGLPVEFPGWQDPVPYLAVADVVLCTSKHESWGASMIEALAAGVPVVAPDVGVAEEAGARVVPRDRLATEVVQVLQAGERGTLRLPLLNKSEWAAAWRNTL